MVGGLWLPLIGLLSAARTPILDDAAYRVKKKTARSACGGANYCF